MLQDSTRESKKFSSTLPASHTKASDRFSGEPCLLTRRHESKYSESSGNRAISTNTHLMGKFRRNMAHITAHLSNKTDAILNSVQSVHVQTKRGTWKALLQQGSQDLRNCLIHRYARTYVLSLSLLTSNKGRRRYKYCARAVDMYKCTTLLAIQPCPRQLLLYVSFFVFHPRPPWAAPDYSNFFCPKTAIFKRK